MNTLMRSEIWCSINIGDLVLQSFTGLVRSAREQNNEKKFNYLKMNNLNFSGDFDLNNLVKVDATKAEVQRYSLALGDFIFNTRNSVELVGKCGVFSKKTNEPLLFNNNLLKIRFIQIDPRLVSYWLNSPLGKHDLRMITSATTSVAAIYQKKLFSLKIPLPPLAEQKIIADKLDTLLAQVETTKARLERIPEILKTFRQSVLAAAVSGKLTEEWRGNNGSLHVDLEQIAYQHKAYFTEAKRKYNEPPEFKVNSSTPKIPDSWRWFRAEQLCDLITKGTTPKKEHMTSSGDIPYIKVYNLTFSGSLDFSIEPTFIPTFVHDNELKRSKVLPGDVLMNIVGPPLGKVSIVPDSHKEWNINQAISIFRPVGGVTNEYLSICLREEFLLELTKSKAKATAGQFNLTLEICRDYSIPVPPLEEQTEIVRRVEELFAFADIIEQKTNAALERVNNLTQSILAKAFRGELTADWRAENPDLISGENSAEALLAKIQAERYKLALEKKAAKKPRKKKA
jgi:type I restriction enzyme S subunit